MYMGLNSDLILSFHAKIMNVSSLFSPSIQIKYRVDTLMKFCHNAAAIYS